MYTLVSLPLYNSCTNFLVLRNHNFSIKFFLFSIFVVRSELNNLSRQPSVPSILFPTPTPPHSALHRSNTTPSCPSRHSRPANPVPPVPRPTDSDNTTANTTASRGLDHSVTDRTVLEASPSDGQTVHHLESIEESGEHAGAENQQQQQQRQDNEHLETESVVKEKNGEEGKVESDIALGKEGKREEGDEVKGEEVEGEGERGEGSKGSISLARVASVEPELRESPAFRFLTRPDLYKFAKVSLLS